MTGRQQGSPCYISLKMVCIIVGDSWKPWMGFEDSLASLLC